MFDQPQDTMECPRCGELMMHGSLRGPVEPVHVETLSSLEDSALVAFICPACGHVELQATSPGRLSRHDISDRDIDRLSDREEP